MKQLKKNILIFLVAATVVFLCAAGWLAGRFRQHGGSFPGPGMLDFSAELAGGYSVHRTSSQHVIIAPEAWNAGTPIIPTLVVECATDGRFILAKRLGVKDQFPENPGSTLTETDPTVQDFWILDTQQQEVHGPLTEAALKSLRTSLSIADTVQLRPVSEFRPASP